LRHWLWNGFSRGDDDDERAAAAATVVVAAADGNLSTIMMTKPAVRTMRSRATNLTIAITRVVIGMLQMILQTRMPELLLIIGKVVEKKRAIFTIAANPT